MEPYKQVIVVDERLELPVGKLGAQVAHAAVAAFLHADDAAQRAWLEQGMPKIVLSLGETGSLQALGDAARAAGLPAYVVADAGRTVIAAGTETCLGIGPAPAAKIDLITGSLSLLR